MSHANVEIVRRFTDAADSGGVEAVFARTEEFFHEDVEWIEDPTWPGGGTYRGVAAIRELIGERTDSFDFEQHTEKLIDAGDDVVAFVQWRGRGHGSGAEAEMKLATVTTLRAGKIIRVRFYLERAEALRAVGLSRA